MNRLAQLTCRAMRGDIVLSLFAMLLLAVPAAAQDTVKVSAEEPRAVQPERPTVATHALPSAIHWNWASSTRPEIQNVAR